MQQGMKNVDKFSVFLSSILSGRPLGLLYFFAGLKPCPTFLIFFRVFVVNFLNPRLDFTPDFDLGFTRLLTLAGLLVLNLLEKRDGLKAGFLFGNLGAVFPANLAVKKVVNLAGFLDPGNEGGDYNIPVPLLHPDGFAVFLRIHRKDTRCVGQGFSLAYLKSQT